MYCTTQHYSELKDALSTTVDKRPDSSVGFQGQTYTVLLYGSRAQNNQL